MTKSTVNLSAKKVGMTLVALLIAVLAACGGTADSTNSQTSSLPGTGGTGIYATGQITGFGSIILSHLKFDEQAADVRIDGVSAESSDLRLGMVANVRGEMALGASKATATKIEVWSVAQGPATEIDAEGMTVGAMRFSVDATTVLDGFTDMTTLQAHTALRVWAIPTSSASGHWVATRIALADSNDWVTTGQVQLGANNASVNGYVLPKALANDLNQGQLVRVAVLLHANSGLPSVAVTNLSQGTRLHDLKAQVEGHVTDVAPGQYFMLDQVVVDASQALFSPGPFYPAPGLHVVVDGVWDSGLLKASTVTYRDSKDLALVELSGPVQKFEGLASFYVRNTECDASVISNLSAETLSKLKEGASVKVLGTKAGRTIKVYHLELI